MKNRKFLALIPTSLLLVLSGTLFLPNKAVVAKAYTVASLPTTIDLNDSDPDEIRNYYSSLSSLSESEKKGTNLLKNLKTILKNGQQYYSYDSGSKIWQAYEIVDRDWTKSPASDISGYDANTNIITGYTYGTSASKSGTNPYIRALYVDRTKENHMKAWALEGTTTTSHGNNAEWCIDREHIWPKSQGFETKGEGGARGDLMHLWPGDSGVNSALHNDEFYGFVNTNTSYTHGYTWEYTKDNYRGVSLTLGTSVATNNIFEPQDSDKGDIARSIFYMVARYNYLSGADSDGIDSNNPNLELVQSNEVLAKYTSTTTVTGKMGILTDLLAWHKMDPVDEYEIHRNNLLYKNYTKNRNPFIDYPQWVDYIWGTATYNGREYQSYDNTPTGSVDLGVDVINGYKSEKTATSIAVTHLPNKVEYTVGDKIDRSGLVVTATFDDESTADVTTSCTLTVDMKSAGEKTVTVKYQSCTTTFQITVKAKKKSSPLGCGGSIIASSVLLSLTAGLTLMFFLIRRKIIKKA